MLKDKEHIAVSIRKKINRSSKKVQFPSYMKEAMFPVEEFSIVAYSLKTEKQTALNQSNIELSITSRRKIDLDTKVKFDSFLNKEINKFKKELEKELKSLFSEIKDISFEDKTIVGKLEEKGRYNWYSLSKLNVEIEEKKLKDSNIKQYILDEEGDNALIEELASYLNDYYENEGLEITVEYEDGVPTIACMNYLSEEEQTSLDEVSTSWLQERLPEDTETEIYVSKDNHCFHLTLQKP